MNVHMRQSAQTGTAFDGTCIADFYLQCLRRYCVEMGRALR